MADIQTIFKREKLRTVAGKITSKISTFNVLNPLLLVFIPRFAT